MKKRGIVGMLLLGLLLIGTTACGSDGETTSQQPVKGDTNIKITADGNIEVFNKVKLTFGSGGKIDKIYVKEGDNVNKGDVLAELDTSALELAETQAQVGLSRAQVALTQAQVDLQAAEFYLETTQDLYTWSDILIAQADVDEAEDYLEYCLERLGRYVPPDEEGNYPTILEYALGDDYPKLPGYEIWQERIVHAQARLNAAKDRLDAMLSGTDPKEVAIKRLRVEIAEQSLELAGQSLELAGQSVKQAQKQLEEASITAPFDGIVSKVGVKEGEFLSPAAYTGTTIIELVDPRYMELTARVDELDVVKVKTGQKVMISIDAIPGTILEGQVTFVSPVAREPVGVVLFEDEDEEKSYEVKIDFNIPENSPIRAGMSATVEIIVG